MTDKEKKCPGCGEPTERRHDIDGGPRFCSKCDDDIRADLHGQIGELQRQLDEERERWQKLEKKVAWGMAGVTRSKDAAQARLIMGANGLKAAGCQEHEALTSDALLAVDEMRRAYAIYDALRSVQIWMKGYL
jgi:hypothetical protein